MITKKEVMILEYCLPNSRFMWASTIMSLILGCDFRDAETLARKVLKK